jgi:hypothetical protein
LRNVLEESCLPQFPQFTENAFIHPGLVTTLLTDKMPLFNSMPQFVLVLAPREAYVLGTVGALLCPTHFETEKEMSFCAAAAAAAAIVGYCAMALA